MSLMKYTVHLASCYVCVTLKDSDPRISFFTFQLKKRKKHLFFLVQAVINNDDDDEKKTKNKKKNTRSTCD